MAPFGVAVGVLAEETVIAELELDVGDGVDTDDFSYCQKLVMPAQNMLNIP
jgi:hypothetical protein